MHYNTRNTVTPLKTFHTARLAAKRIEASDFAELYRMNQDPRVMATLGGLRSKQQTREFVTASIEHWNQHGFGVWMFHDRQTGQFVGRAGLRHTEVGGKREIELLYAVMTEFWGTGIASEMAAAILTLCFDRLGLSNIVAFTLHTNIASQRVMQKSGLIYERDIVHAGLPHVLYRLKSPAR